MTDNSKLQIQNRALGLLVKVAKGSFYTLALGAMSIGISYGIDPALLVIPQGIILGGMSTLLDRVIQGEKVNEDEILEIIKSSGIEKEFPVTTDNRTIVQNIINYIGLVSTLDHDEQAEVITSILNNSQLFEQKSGDLSLHIIQRLKRANTTIEKLTQEQTKVLKLFWLNNRAAISGCAGSGKTIIAAETIRRLSQKNRFTKTLFLCHNPFLARYVETLLTGTGAKVVDFTSWVYDIINVEKSSKDKWTKYHEPTSDQIEQAFLSLITDKSEKYDAIIVDEGQDFREQWWDLVEEALVDKQNGKFWIFHDDNQAIIPRNIKYPLHTSIITLDTNCRNTGNIFELVKIFHPQSPYLNTELQNKGIVNSSIFQTESEMFTLVNDAIEECYHAGLQNIIVLTTQQEGELNQILDGVEVSIRPKWKWQDVVYEYLGHTELSNQPVPTKEDIKAVMEHAKKVIPALFRNSSQIRKMNWKATDNHIVLSNPFKKDDKKRGRGFFLLEDWAEGIPPVPKKIISTEAASENHIPLKSVDSFKGLEADNVVLVIPANTLSDRKELESILYVGLSRARFLLHIIVDKSVASTVPQLFENQEI